MMIAISEDEWRVFSRMRPAEMVATLRELAQKVSLKAYRKSPRGPKKPAKTRGDHQSIPCLHRQTAQESQNQCSDTLTGLLYRVIDRVTWSSKGQRLRQQKDRDGDCEQRVEFHYCSG